MSRFNLIAAIGTLAIIVLKMCRILDLPWWLVILLAILWQFLMFGFALAESLVNDAIMRHRLNL